MDYRDVSTLTIAYEQNNWSTLKVAKYFKADPETILKWARKFGIQTDKYHKGYISTQSGYILIKAENHPNADSKGYVREHILLMEKNIGRYLNDDEIVHHINGIKNDNRIENLVIMSDEEHRKLHSGKPRKIVDIIKAVDMIEAGYTMPQVESYLGVCNKTLIKKLREAGLYKKLPKGSKRRKHLDDLVE